MSPGKPSSRRKRIRRHTQAVRTALDRAYTNVVAIEELSKGQVPELYAAMAQLIPILGMQLEMMDRVDAFYGYQKPDRNDSDLGVRLAAREASAPPPRGDAPTE